jgi:rhamnosyltransferase
MPLASRICSFPEIMGEEKPQPRFAIFLAAYNGMHYIEDQISTILHQKFVNIQIFISVDKSVDGTEIFLKKLAFAEKRIVLLPFDERFGSAALNFYRLIREVKLHDFDYLSFADQDDLWHPEKLWRAHCLMRKKNALGYSSNVTAFWPNGFKKQANKAQPPLNLDFMFESAGPGCTYVLHKELAIKLQQMVIQSGNNINLVQYHDWLIYAFARARKIKWVIDQWSSLNYRQHQYNQIGLNFGFRSFWMRAKKILSGHGFEQALLISDLVDFSFSPVVQKGLLGGRFGYIWLAFHANQCRRRRLDRLWFFIACFIFFITNKKLC